MATAAGQWWSQGCVFDSSISSGDAEVRRRPYHKNCGCALHLSGSGSGSVLPHDAPCSGSKISYPVRRSWSGASLASMAPPPQAGLMAPSREGRINRSVSTPHLGREED